MRGEGMAERVHRQARVFVDLIEERGHRLLDGSNTDTDPCASDEHRVAIAAGADALENVVAPDLVLPQRANGVVTDRNDPLLAPLATNFRRLIHHVDIAAAQALELRETHAGRVEQLE